MPSGRGGPILVSLKVVLCDGRTGFCVICREIVMQMKKSHRASCWSGIVGKGAGDLQKVIALVGDQAAPLLLLAAAMEEEFEIHIISTAERREKAEYVKEALEDFSKVRGRYIHEAAYNDMGRISSLAAELIGDGQGWVVDITGGTKLMALGLFSAARNSKATIVYVDTAGKTILNVTEPTQQQVFCQGFHQPISYKTIFKAYGKWAQEEESIAEEAVMRSLLDYISANVRRWSEFWQWYSGLQQNRSQQAKRSPLPAKYLSDGNKQVLTFLQKLGWMCIEERKGQQVFYPCEDKVADYLRRGSWLEDLVHYKLCRQFGEVRKNISIFVPKSQLPTEEAEGWYKENEVDVLVNENGRLVFIECKAGQGKSAIGSIANELPKIENVPTKSAGYFAKSAIVVAFSREKLSQEFAEKARRAKIQVFCVEEIGKLSQHVKALLG